VSADADAASELDWVVAVDSSINWVRTNTPPPAVWLSPIPKMTQGPGPNDNDRLPWGPRSGSGEVALNRLITPWAVPGWFTSKLHLTYDGHGLPLSIGLTRDNVNDTTMLQPSSGRDQRAAGRVGSNIGFWA
jgi:hypothetical protein